MGWRNMHDGYYQLSGTERIANLYSTVAAVEASASAGRETVSADSDAEKVSISGEGNRSLMMDRMTSQVLEKMYPKQDDVGPAGNESARRHRTGNGRKHMNIKTIPPYLTGRRAEYHGGSRKTGAEEKTAVGNGVSSDRVQLSKDYQDMAQAQKSISGSGESAPKRSSRSRTSWKAEATR